MVHRHLMTMTLMKTAVEPPDNVICFYTKIFNKFETSGEIQLQTVGGYNLLPIILYKTALHAPSTGGF